MKPIKLNPISVIEDQSLYDTQLHQQTQYIQCTIQGDGDPVRFDEHYFKRCVFEDVLFENGQISDCIFENCDLSNTQWDKVKLIRVGFQNCKLLGVSFYNTHFRDVTFDHNLMNFSNFSSSVYHDVLFKNCQCTSCAFQLIKHDVLSIESTNIDDCDFFDTNLESLNFSTCTFDTLRFSANLISGLTVSYHQSPLILALLGLKVE